MLPGAPPSALGGADAPDALNVSPGVLWRTSGAPQAHQGVRTLIKVLLQVELCVQLFSI